MRLLVEIGNSRVKWTLAGPDGLVDEPTSAGHADSSWALQLPETAIDSVWFASVATYGAEAPLLEWATEHGVAEPCRIRSTATAGGVVNAYAEPSRLGVDRLLACVAAHQCFPGESVLVADAGTALTVDYVAADGRHEGGLICPGVSTMRTAIRADTQVRAQESESSGELLGCNTDAAVGQGTLLAALGVLERVGADLSPTRLLLTGGEAPLLAPHLGDQWETVPALVLEGLDRLSRASDGGWQI